MTVPPELEPPTLAVFPAYDPAAASCGSGSAVACWATITEQKIITIQAYLIPD